MADVLKLIQRLSPKSVEHQLMVCESFFNRYLQVLTDDLSRMVTMV
jgi:hypothetical protein